ncbi:AMIN domain-containing protein [Candidatus Hydrogenedentota bacterium]
MFPKKLIMGRQLVSLMFVISMCVASAAYAEDTLADRKVEVYKSIFEKRSIPFTSELAEKAKGADALTGIELVEEEDKAELVLTTSGAPTFSTITADGRFMLDLDNTLNLTGQKKLVPEGPSALGAVKLTQSRVEPDIVTRIVVAAEDPEAIVAAGKDGKITLTIAKDPIAVDPEVAKILAMKESVLKVGFAKVGADKSADEITAAAANASALLDIVFQQENGQVVITIFTQGEPELKEFRLPQGNRMVLDLANTINLQGTRTIEVGQGDIVKSVRTSLFQLEPQPVSRVVFDLGNAAEVQIIPHAGCVEVRIPPTEALPEAFSAPKQPTVADLKAALNERRQTEAKLAKEIEERKTRKEERRLLAAGGPEEPLAMAGAETQEEPIEETPPEETPAKEPVEEAPAEAPVEEPVEEAPAEEAPAEEPVEEVPAEEAPAEEPVEKAPAEESPAAEPIEEAPAEEAPVEEPVEETPAEEAVESAEKAIKLEEKGPEIPVKPAEEEAPAEEAMAVEETPQAQPEPAPAVEDVIQAEAVEEHISDLQTEEVEANLIEELQFTAVPIEEVIQALVTQADIDVVVGEGVTGEVTGHWTNLPAVTILRDILEVRNYILLEDEGKYAIQPLNAIQVGQKGTVTRKFEIRYQDADTIGAAIRPFVQGQGALIQIVPRAENTIAMDNFLIVNALPDVIDTVEQMIEVFDVRKRQVEIHMLLVESVISDNASFGIQWQSSGVLHDRLSAINEAGNFNPTGLPSSTGAPNATNAGRARLQDATATDFSGAFVPALGGAGSFAVGYLADNISVSAFIRGEVASRRARIRANPAIIVVDGYGATLGAVDTFPYQQLNAIADTGVVATTGHRDVGVVLSVSPRVHGDGYITVSMSATDSSLIGIDNTTGEPITADRNATTVQTLKDGQIMVLGGLRKRTDLNTNSSLPFLRHLPLVGKLFTNPVSNNEDSQLLIFMQVRIIPDDMPTMPGPVKEIANTLWRQERKVDSESEIKYDLLNPDKFFQQGDIIKEKVLGMHEE